MPTIAILDDVIPSQLAERPGELDPVHVIWSGTDLDALRRDAGALRPDVLALDLSRLGADPVAESQSLAALTGAQLVLMLYDFAPSSLIREAARSGARPVKTPIRLTALRTQMTSVIVRRLRGLRPRLPEPRRQRCCDARPPSHQDRASARRDGRGAHCALGPREDRALSCALSPR